MGRAGRDDKNLADLDELIGRITADACGDDEKLWAFRQVFEDEVPLPSDGFVIGEPVSVTEIDYAGNERRGLTARCRREDGAEKPRRQWSYAGHPYLSADIESSRLDARALGLVPLRLEAMGTWDPNEHSWGEEGEPVEEWAKPIIARGSRPAFEMEQVLPGADPQDPFADPITESNDLKDAGDGAEAYRLLMELCQADLRCLDAHAHLGNFVFDHSPKDAIRHYDVGVRIGELSLGEGFDGLLRWGHVDNRPYLRCMYGYGLCLWRLDRYDEARRVFEKMLWLNPSDNQGVRFLIEDVRAGKAWEENRDQR
jgi:tetratricopeptide (TPR) repeat protein